MGAGVHRVDQRDARAAPVRGARAAAPARGAGVLTICAWRRRARRRPSWPEPTASRASATGTTGSTASGYWSDRSTRCWRRAGLTALLSGVGQRDLDATLGRPGAGDPAGADLRRRCGRPGPLRGLAARVSRSACHPRRRQAHLPDLSSRPPAGCPTHHRPVANAGRRGGPARVAPDRDAHRVRVEPSLVDDARVRVRRRAVLPAVVLGGGEAGGTADRGQRRHSSASGGRLPDRLALDERGGGSGHRAPRRLPVCRPLVGQHPTPRERRLRPGWRHARGLPGVAVTRSRHRGRSPCRSTVGVHQRLERVGGGEHAGAGPAAWPRLPRGDPRGADGRRLRRRRQRSCGGAATRHHRGATAALVSDDPDLRARPGVVQEGPAQRAVPGAVARGHGDPGRRRRLDRYRCRGAGARSAATG